MPHKIPFNIHNTIMQRKIFVNGRFDNALAQQFKAEIKRLVCKDAIFHVEINSHGGNLGRQIQMSDFAKEISEQYNARFIAEMKWAESAGLLLALSFHERHVIASSVGIIHLPVHARGIVNGSEEGLQESRKRTIRFILKNSNLKEEDVFNLENQLLSANEMLRYGLATKKVPIFMRL